MPITVGRFSTGEYNPDIHHSGSSKISDYCRCRCSLSISCTKSSVENIREINFKILIQVLILSVGEWIYGEREGGSQCLGANQITLYCITLSYSIVQCSALHWYRQGSCQLAVTNIFPAASLNHIRIIITNNSIDRHTDHSLNFTFLEFTKIFCYSICNSFHFICDSTLN